MIKLIRNCKHTFLYNNCLFKWFAFKFNIRRFVQSHECRIYVRTNNFLNFFTKTNAQHREEGANPRFKACVLLAELQFYDNSSSCLF